MDLNTGEEVIVCESGDSIEEYVISYDNMSKGSIEENYITMDVSVYNIADISKDYRYRLKIDINDFGNKYLLKNVNGIKNPAGNMYAVPGLFTDTLGDTISQWSIPFDEL